MRAAKEYMVPQLRFKQFDSIWRHIKIGDMATVTSGGTPSTLKRDYWNGTIRWMNSGELNLKRVHDVANRITELGLKNSSTKLIPPNSVLIGLAGQGKTRGTAAMNLVELCTNQSIAAVLPNPDTYNSEYLFQNIDSRYEELRRLSTGDGGRGGLNLSIIKAFKIPLPSLPEQQKIAVFLSSVDKKIQQLNKKVEFLKQYKKGVMQKIFSQETDVGGSRTPLKNKKQGEQIRFKDENGNDFPDWEEKRLGDVGETFNGLTGKTKEDFGFGVPYIQYMQIYSNSSVNIAHCEFVKIDAGEKQNRVQRGDVFFTTSSETPSEVGMSSVLLHDVGEAYLNSFCFGFRVHSTKDYLPEFLRYLLRSESFRRKVLRLAQGSTRYNLSKRELMKLYVAIPQVLEQKKISSFLSSIDDRICQSELQLMQTQTFKKGLLQQMFV